MSVFINFKKIGINYSGNFGNDLEFEIMNNKYHLNLKFPAILFNVF